MTDETASKRARTRGDLIGSFTLAYLLWAVPRAPARGRRGADDGDPG